MVLERMFRWSARMAFVVRHSVMILALPSFHARVHECCNQRPGVRAVFPGMACSSQCVVCSNQLELERLGGVES